MFLAGTKLGTVAPPDSAPEPSLVDSWRRIVEPVQPFLDQVTQRLAEQVTSFEPEIAPYAQYALTNQGKHLRPALVALSGGVPCPRHTETVAVAVIIEMIHLATLVHDDVMDEAAVRRRRPTLAANWGNQISVLLGDCLFAQALKLAAGFPTTEVCHAVATATRTVCSGEIIQTNRQGRLELSRAEYFRILQMKTGELFALSCDLGAWLADSSPAEREALRCYGLNLGTAYQIYDDCLDIFGQEKAAGKSLGTDLANGKLTLPILITLEKAAAEEKHNFRGMISRWAPDHAVDVRRLLDKYQALEESRQVILRFLESARRALARLPASARRQSLSDVCLFLARQTEALSKG
jgi:octaprenyl-diphosphate synthase